MALTAGTSSTAQPPAAHSKTTCTALTPSLSYTRSDFSCSLTTDAIFTQALVAFVNAVISDYARSPGPAAATTAFIALGPMSPTRPLAACAAAVAQLRAAGTPAFLLNMTGGTLDGCGGHPGALGHRQMALQAAPQIQAAMGW